jgi:hypothetical protein
MCVAKLKGFDLNLSMTTGQLRATLFQNTIYKKLLAFRFQFLAASPIADCFSVTLKGIYLYGKETITISELALLRLAAFDRRDTEIMSLNPVLNIDVRNVLFCYAYVVNLRWSESPS